MTVKSTQSSITFDAASVVSGVGLPFPFSLFAARDLQVVYNGTYLALLGTHYRVTLTADFSAATVTPNDALVALLAAYPGGLTLRRRTAYTQDLSIPTNARLPEKAIENAFDKGVLRDQELLEQISDIAVPSAATIMLAQTYFGGLATDPAARPDNSALQVGDKYFNTISTRERIYTSSGWGNGSITEDEFSRAGARQPGDIFESARITPPPYSLFCDGSAVPRATYPLALAALTLAFTGSQVQGQNTISGVSKDLRSLGLEGATLEAVGFSTTIVSVTATTVVISSTFPSTVSANTFTAFPWGNGDGASTFNVPNKLGRVTMGRIGMNGAASATYNPAAVPWVAQVGGQGGEGAHFLTLSELPIVTPVVTATQAPHTHSYAGANNAGTIGNATGTLYANAASFTTSSAQPAITVTSQPFGGGLAHNVTQPTSAGNIFIFMGQ